MQNSKLTTQEINRYAKQILLEEIGISGQSKLKNAKILCIGAGGLGSPLLLYLTAAGVGNIGIIDADNVDLSNLQRQVIYQTEDINKPKVFVAQQRLHELNPNCAIDTFHAALNAQNAEAIITNYDLIIDGSDNFTTKYLAHDICFKLNKTYFYAAASKFSGYFTIFKRDSSPCLHCIFPYPKINSKIDCNSTGVLGTSPGLLGIIQATESIKWIIGIGESLLKKLLITDLLTMSFKTIHLTKDPHCNLCVHNNFENIMMNNTTGYALQAEDFKSYLQNTKNLILIDVRSVEEHKLRNLGGLSIPLDSIHTIFNNFAKDSPILLYCQTDRRSLYAAEILLAQGFTAVKYLIGGVSKQVVCG